VLRPKQATGGTQGLRLCLPGARPDAAAGQPSFAALQILAKRPRQATEVPVHGSQVSTRAHLHEEPGARARDSNRSRSSRFTSHNFLTHESRIKLILNANQAQQSARLCVLKKRDREKKMLMTLLSCGSFLPVGPIRKLAAERVWLSQVSYPLADMLIALSINQTDHYSPSPFSSLP
jgi:hypothetical protein